MFFSKSNKPSKRTWLFCDGGAGEVLTLGEQPAFPPQAVVASEANHPITSHSITSRPIHNTRNAGCGVVARNEAGEILQWAWRSLPPMTNNEAEYAGLLLGLELATHLRVGEIGCVLDSAVVVMQMQGRAAVNSPLLRPWHRQACEAVRRFQSVEFRLIPRELNYLADSLTWQARQPWEVTKEWLTLNP